MSAKFKGDFKQLIPMGYTFQKLYAANYKCYHKGNPDFKIWIWVKNKDIEVDWWYGYEQLLIEAIRDNSIHSMLKHNHVAINKLENKLEKYNMVKHDFLCKFDFDELKQLPKEQMNELKRKHEEKYSVNLITEDMINIIKELIEKDMI